MTLIDLIMCIESLVFGWIVGVCLGIDRKDIKIKVVFTQFVVILLYAILLYMIFIWGK